MKIKKMIKDGKEFSLGGDSTGGSGITTTVRDDFMVTQIGDHMASYHMFERPIKSVEILNLYEKAIEIGDTTNIKGIFESLSLKFDEKATLVQITGDEFTKSTMEMAGEETNLDWKVSLKYEGVDLLSKKDADGNPKICAVNLIDNQDIFMGLIMIGAVSFDAENPSAVWFLGNDLRLRIGDNNVFVSISADLHSKEKLELNL